ncbi:MAG TPA: hypothetical protein VGR64_05525 [Terracidiphilus sp.]|nr:hypothetical protein [Terracidiphilus sp.]
MTRRAVLDAKDKIIRNNEVATYTNNSPETLARGRLPVCGLVAAARRLIRPTIS